MQFRNRKAILWAPMLATGALLLLPQSNWLVRSQFRGCFVRSPDLISPIWGGCERPTEEYAEKISDVTQLPDEIGVQMAAALNNVYANGDLGSENSDKDERVNALLALRSRYSNSPVLYANILRYMNARLVCIGRQEEQRYLTNAQPLSPSLASARGGPPGSPPETEVASKEPEPNQPEALALFEECAKKGMALDPDNAYFPLMLAVGRFAAHRDKEAIVAIETAATRPAWREYYQEEVRGQWRLAERRYGEPGGLRRTAMAADIFLPHYLQFRSVARLAVLDAMNSEMARASSLEGLRERRAIMEVGVRMRTSASSLVGNRIGAAMEQVAIERPGGALPLKKSGYGDSKSVALARRQAFRDYLIKIGHADEVHPVNAEMDAIDQVDDISRRGVNNGGGVFDLDHLLGLVVLESSGSVLLYMALWMLIVGAIAVRLSNVRSIRERQPLAPSVRTGLLTALFGPVLWGLGSLIIPTIDESLIANLPVLVPLAGSITAGVLVAIACLWLRRYARDGKPVLPFFVSLVVGFVGVASLAWGLFFQSSLWQIGSSLASCFSSQADSATTTRFNPMVFVFGTALLGASVPLILFVIVATQSRLKRVPVSVGTVAAFRRMAVPLSVLLLTVYMGVLGITLQQEVQTRAGLEAMLTHEGRYLAGLIGAKWPGKTH